MREAVHERAGPGDVRGTHAMVFWNKGGLDTRFVADDGVTHVVLLGVLALYRR